MLGEALQLGYTASSLPGTRACRTRSVACAASPPKAARTSALSGWTFDVHYHHGAGSYSTALTPPMRPSARMAARQNETAGPKEIRHDRNSTRGDARPRAGLG